MSSPPPSYSLKFDRADEHLLAVHQMISGFLEAHPYDIDVQPDTQPNQYILIGRYLDRPPVKLPRLIGDCLHNLRSALDHMAFALAERNSRIAPDRTEFPIFLERLEYWATSKKGIAHRASGLWKVRGMSTQVQTLIEALQPYNRGDGPPDRHPLWLLHELSNEDKHRVLRTAAAAMSNVTISIRSTSGDHVQTETLTPRAFEDGTKLARVEFTFNLDPNQEVQFDTECLFDVALSPSGPAKGARLFPILQDIRNFVRQVLVDLQPFLA